MKDEQIGEPAVLELAHRVNGGIEVTLFWSPVDDSTAIEVWDAASEERIVFGVRAEHALDAFYHPFAQLAASFDELAPVADA
jgi:hypothetical protein